MNSNALLLAMPFNLWPGSRWITSMKAGRCVTPAGHLAVTVSLANAF
jgi:hypothetical protein